ncbi:MAG: hypothetical protein V1765_03255 [bacterium]
MLEAIKNNISGAIRIALVIFLTISFFGAIVIVSLARADTATTGVTVGNSVPAFDNTPAETVASHNGAGTGNTANNPTNEGSAVTFTADATDANGDQWKLLVCSTDDVTGIGCAATQYCISASAVNSGSTNTCSYTTLNGNPESNTWYAFACDATACMPDGTGNQGSGNSGTPFYVNHDPSFSAYSNDSDGDPGDIVTFTATTSSDSDSDAAQDLLTLYVCLTASFSGGASPACGGTELCHELTPEATPDCSYTTPLPDQTINGYGYVVDNHGLVSSTGGAQGTNDDIIITNTTPTITAGNVTLLDTDDAGNMVLTVSEGATTNFEVQFIVTDANSCKTSANGDEIASAIANVYLASVTQAGCDEESEETADGNNGCYVGNASCVQAVGVDSCTNNTDTTVGWSCTFSLQYHATAGAWQVSVKATDDDAAASTLVEATTGNTLNSSLFYDVDNGASSIAYGTLAPSATSASDITTNVQATGNVAIDTNVSSAQANALCSDYATCAAYTIADSYQHHDETAATAYASMTALSTTPTRVETNIAKTTVTGSPENANVYWKISIPGGQYATAYTGSNTIAGVAAN